MKKVFLLSGALALAALVGFGLGHGERDDSVVEGQARGTVFPKVEIHVVIDGVEGDLRAGVGGLGAECEVLTEVDPDTNVVRKLPGRVKYGDITLKRGYVAGRADAETTAVLHRWYQDVKQGVVTRKNGSIIMVSEDGSEVARYNFFEAWPCKWKGFQAPNAEAGFPIEEIGLVVQKVLKAR